MLARPIPAEDNFRFFADSESRFLVSVYNETVPTFLDLLQSAPSLFANISLAIDEASGPFDVDFFNQFRMLAVDFVSIANDSCGISLSQEEVDNVTGLFVQGLTTFRLYLCDCVFLNQTIVEQAVAGVDFNDVAFSLPIQLEIATGSDPAQNERLKILIQRVLTPPTDDIPAAAQDVLTEFLFHINGICGIPSLSDVTLELLDQYFLDALVEEAMANNSG